MSEKKPYVPPKIFQVELNQDQAILTSCSAGVTNPSVNRTASCTAGTCKRAMVTSGNSGAHSS